MNGETFKNLTSVVKLDFEYSLFDQFLNKTKICEYNIKYLRRILYFAGLPVVFDLYSFILLIHCLCSTVCIFILVEHKPEDHLFHAYVRELVYIILK